MKFAPSKTVVLLSIASSLNAYAKDLPDSKICYRTQDEECTGPAPDGALRFCVVATHQRSFRAKEPALGNYVKGDFELRATGKQGAVFSKMFHVSSGEAWTGHFAEYFYPSIASIDPKTGEPKDPNGKVTEVTGLNGNFNPKAHLKSLPGHPEYCLRQDSLLAGESQSVRPARDPFTRDFTLIEKLETFPTPTGVDPSYAIQVAYLSDHTVSVMAGERGAVFRFKSPLLGSEWMSVHRNGFSQMEFEGSYHDQPASLFLDIAVNNRAYSFTDKAKLRSEVEGQSSTSDLAGERYYVKKLPPNAVTQMHSFYNGEARLLEFDGGFEEGTISSFLLILKDPASGEPVRFVLPSWFTQFGDFKKTSDGNYWLEGTLDDGISAAAFSLKTDWVNRRLITKRAN